MNEIIKFIRSFFLTLFPFEKSATHPIHEVDEKKERAFQFQLEMLSKEIDMIDKLISRFDEHGRATKYWTLIIWGGTMVTILSQLSQFKNSIGITAIIPLLFWLIDTRWSQYLRKAVYRLDKISEFLTSPNLVESFRKSELIGTHLLDTRGKKYEDEKDTSYKKKTNYLRIMITRPELAFFYCGLILCSLILNLFFVYQS